MGRHQSSPVNCTPAAEPAKFLEMIPLRWMDRCCVFNVALWLIDLNQGWQIWPATCFCKKVYQHMATPTRLPIFCGCFHTAVARVSSCGGPQTSCRALYIYCLCLYGSSQTPVLNRRASWRGWSVHWESCYNTKMMLRRVKWGTFPFLSS